MSWSVSASRAITFPWSLSSSGPRSLRCFGCSAWTNRHGDSIVARRSTIRTRPVPSPALTWLLGVLGTGGGRGRRWLRARGRPRARAGSRRFGRLRRGGRRGLLRLTGDILEALLDLRDRAAVHHEERIPGEIAHRDSRPLPDRREGQVLATGRSLLGVRLLLEGQFERRLRGEGILLRLGRVILERDRLDVRLAAQQQVDRVVLHRTLGEAGGVPGVPFSLGQHERRAAVACGAHRADAVLPEPEHVLAPQIAGGRRQLGPERGENRSAPAFAAGAGLAV